MHNSEIDFYPLPESHFAISMDEQVLPYLTHICQSGYFAASDDAGKLYYEVYCPDNAKGTVVISHGFCESIEKYKEVIYYFTKLGFQVFLADYRGHGRSFRETSHPNMVYVKDFRDYVKDLHTFVTTIVKPTSSNLPLYLYGHSMGGGVGALYLEAYPHDFTKAVLSSPMLAINMGPIPVFVAQVLGFVMVKLHRGQHYAPGQHAFIAGEKCEESGSICQERFQYYQSKKESEPLYQSSGSSYNWAYASLCACHSICRKKNCAKITIPVLVFESPNDAFVKASGIHHFVKNTSFAKLSQISHSRHEIYNSGSDVIYNYYMEIFHFINN